MSGMTFKVMDRWTNPQKVLTWDQMTLDNGKKNNPIRSIVLTCNAGDIATLHVYYYDIQEDGTYNVDGDVEEYVVGSPNDSEPNIIPIFLREHIERESKVE